MPAQLYIDTFGSTPGTLLDSATLNTSIEASAYAVPLAGTTILPTITALTLSYPATNVVAINAAGTPQFFAVPAGTFTLSGSYAQAQNVCCVLDTAVTPALVSFHTIAAPSVYTLGANQLIALWYATTDAGATTFLSTTLQAPAYPLSPANIGADIIESASASLGVGLTVSNTLLDNLNRIRATIAVLNGGTYPSLKAALFVDGSNAPSPLILDGVTLQTGNVTGGLGTFNFGVSLGNMTGVFGAGLHSDGLNTYLSAVGGSFYLRPQGGGVTGNQTVIDSAGNLSLSGGVYTGIPSPVGGTSGSLASLDNTGTLRATQALLTSSLGQPLSIQTSSPVALGTFVSTSAAPGALMIGPESGVNVIQSGSTLATGSAAPLTISNMGNSQTYAAWDIYGNMTVPTVIISAAPFAGSGNLILGNGAQNAIDFGTAGNQEPSVGSAGQKIILHNAGTPLTNASIGIGGTSDVFYNTATGNSHQFMINGVPELEVNGAGTTFNQTVPSASVTIDNLGAVNAVTLKATGAVYAGTGVYTGPVGASAGYIDSAGNLHAQSITTPTTPITVNGAALPIINALSLGFVGDGLTNNYTAMTNLGNYFGNTIFFPAGTYAINLTASGAGSGVVNPYNATRGCSLVGEGVGRTVFAVTVAAGNSNVGSGWLVVQSPSISLSHLSIIQNAGILCEWVSGGGNISLHDLHITQSASAWVGVGSPFFAVRAMGGEISDCLIVPSTVSFGQNYTQFDEAGFNLRLLVRNSTLASVLLERSQPSPAPLIEAIWEFRSNNFEWVSGTPSDLGLLTTDHATDYAFILRDNRFNFSGLPTGTSGNWQMIGQFSAGAQLSYTQIVDNVVIPPSPSAASFSILPAGLSLSGSVVIENNGILGTGSMPETNPLKPLLSGSNMFTGISNTFSNTLIAGSLSASSLGVTGTSVLSALSAQTTTLSSLTVSGPTSLTGSLTVSGLTSLTGGVTTTGALDISGSLAAPVIVVLKNPNYILTATSYGSAYSLVAGTGSTPETYSITTLSPHSLINFVFSAISGFSGFTTTSYPSITYDIRLTAAPAGVTTPVSVLAAPGQAAAFSTNGIYAYPSITLAGAYRGGAAGTYTFSIYAVISTANGTYTYGTTNNTVSPAAQGTFSLWESL